MTHPAAKAARIAERRREIAHAMRVMLAQHGPDMQAWQRRVDANWDRLVSDGVVVEQDGITGVYNDGQ